VQQTVDQEAYVRAAISLALRRHQVAISHGRRRSLLEVDLERLRREVRALLLA